MSSHIDSMRKKFENPTEWKLRREFLLRNVNHYPPDRLECLSHCFIHMEMYGNSYPKEVMEEVRRISEGIIDEADKKRFDSVLKPEAVKFVASDDNKKKSKRKKKLDATAGIAFVKSGSDDSCAPDNKDSETPKNPYANFVKPPVPEINDSPSNLPPTNKKSSKTSLDERFEMAEKNSLITERQLAARELLHEAKISLAKGTYGDIVSSLHTTASRLRLNLSADFVPAPPHGFTCYMLMNMDTVVGVATANSKKQAKTAAFTAFINREIKEIEIVPDDKPNRYKIGVTKLSLSEDLPSNKRRKETVQVFPPCFDGFYIKEVWASQPLNAVNVLRNALDYFHIPVTINVSEPKPPQETYTAFLLIDGKEVGNCSSASKVEARNGVAEVFLTKLRGQYWTLFMRQSGDFMLTKSKNGVSKDPETGKLENVDNSLPTNNIGARMMLKMGYKGSGGIGKDCSGRAEPVSSDITVVRRQGLGTSSNGCMRSFRKFVQSMLSEYIATGKEEDLCFSTEFSNEERQWIHTEVRKMGLVSRSWNTSDGGRCLVVGRKRTPQELFNWVKSNGGHTSRYELIPPGERSQKTSSIEQEDVEMPSVCFGE